MEAWRLALNFSRTPAESRKAWASKTRFRLSFVLDLMLLGLAIVPINPRLIKMRALGFG
jgi:hypothetical protein